jgi:hypothetical protein
MAGFEVATEVVVAGLLAPRSGLEQMQHSAESRTRAKATPPYLIMKFPETEFTR